MRYGHNSAAQKLGKTAFSTYLFQLSGSKFLLHKLIQLPILAQCSMEQNPGSAAPPAALHFLGPVLMKCITDFQEHKKTKEYKQAVARAEKRDSAGRRLSQQIWEQSRQLSWNLTTLKHSSEPLKLTLVSAFFTKLTFNEKSQAVL